MDIRLAERLVDELEHHPPLTPEIIENRTALVSLLQASSIRKVGYYKGTIKLIKTRIEDFANAQSYELSPRRLLRNSSISYIEPATIDRFFEILYDIFGVHNSDIWVERLRSDESLLKLMHASSHPYSLLAKFTSYDYLKDDMVVRPLLVIPEVKDKDAVYRWEDANTYHRNLRTRLYNLYQRLKTPSETSPIH